jgi:pyruvate kinase
MDVARINLSHGTEGEHAHRIREVRNASRNLGRPLAVLADLPGPKFRVGELDGGLRELRDGSRIVLAEDAQAADELPIRHRELLAALHPGESVYLSDGAIVLRVVAAAVDRVACEVHIGGTVRSGSGINVPESDLPGLVPTAQDRRKLAFAAAQGVDWIGVSFVQSAADLVRVRAELPDRGAPLLVAKIEKRLALAALDEIVAAADGVMVARGDLGVETDLAHIPLVQKRIIAAANAMGRPVITATQMLESMVEHDRPTRAEVTDVANAVLDGTDAVMLSAESAIGRHPVAAAAMLRRVIVATEAEHGARIAANRLQASRDGRADEAVFFSACHLAQQLDACAILTEVCNVSQAAALARFRPTAPIVALVADERLGPSLAVVSGVSPLHVAPCESSETRVLRAARWLREHASAHTGDPAVVLTASAEPHETADTLRVVRLP